MGTQPPPQKGGESPIFGYVHCGQTAVWIKIPLGTEVNLSPGDVVLDGSQLPLKGAQPPSFRPMSIVAKWLDG